MSNDRIYLYDNIKGLLIFLVVFAHLSEPASKLTGVGKYIYLLIYSFHMPAFVYLTGIFSSFKIKKDFTRLIVPYIVFQILYVLFAVYILNEKINENIKPPLTTPYWLMWFLPCTFVWRLSDSFFKKLGFKCYCALIAVFFSLALLAGRLGFIGYTFSLSRLICLMPFYMLGSICGTKIRINKNVAVSCFIIYLTVFAVPAMLHLNGIKPDIFYYTYSYKSMGYGIGTRLWIMVSAIFASVCLIGLMTNKQTYLCRLGQNSICIYLLHGFIVKLLNNVMINLSVSVKIVFAFIIALFITWVLSLPIVKKVYDYIFSLEFLIKNDSNIKV